MVRQVGGAVPASENVLQTPWTLYFDRKMAAKSGDFSQFEKNLVKLGHFNTVESFWRHFSHMTLPDALPADTNYYMFRHDVIPAWETFPRGGAWIIRIKKRNGVANRLWEELLFACIGELFAEPDLVGVVFSARGREDCVSVWNRDGHSPEIRIRIGEKLKSLLNLDAKTQLDYKHFSSALKDGSSFRNATTFSFVAKEGEQDTNQ